MVVPQKKTKKVAALKKKGRPATGRMRAKVLQVRMSDAEHAALDRKAEEAGMSLHAYARSRLGLKD